MVKFLAGIILLFFSLNGMSQTCCSGGVPVSSNIGFNPTEKGILQVSISAEFNVLTSLFTESEKLNDDLRKRTTQSFLLRGNYQINNHFSGELFFPIVRQTRKIYRSQGFQSDFDSTFGLGDPLVLAFYRPVMTSLSFQIGAGIQIPLGSTSKKNNQGLFLVEDLQPGSGAWNQVYIASISYAFKNRPVRNLIVRSIYKNTGKNSNSRNGLQAYKFGNDVQIIASFSDQLLIGKSIVDISVKGRFRITENDFINDEASAATGGKWVFSGIALGVQINANTTIKVNGEIPVYSFVNDTQLSPSYIFNIGYFKAIHLGKKESI